MTVGGKRKRYYVVRFLEWERGQVTQTWNFKFKTLEIPKLYLAKFLDGYMGRVKTGWYWNQTADSQYLCAHYGQDRMIEATGLDWVSASEWRQFKAFTDPQTPRSLKAPKARKQKCKT